MENQLLNKKTAIDAKEIDFDHYFLSLLQAASEHQLLDEKQLNDIQISTIELLGKKSFSYNGGSSTSIRHDVAEIIMESIIYTMGVELKSYENPMAALEAIKTQSILELYNNGYKKIETKRLVIDKIGKYLKVRHVSVGAGCFDEMCEHYAGRFLTAYNSRYEAQTNVCIMDYPIYVPLKVNNGIEGAQKYMESLYMENQFLQIVPLDTIKNVLHKRIADYQNQPANILSPILAELCLQTLFPLEMQEGNITKIAQKILSIPVESLKKAMEDCVNQFMESNHLSSASTIRYIHESIAILAEEFYFAAQHDGMGQYIMDSEKIRESCVLHLGRRMSNEDFCHVLDEVVQCDDFDSRFAIMKKKVHALPDYEEIMRSVLFTEKETKELLSILHETELAYFYKKYVFADEYFTDEHSQNQSIGSALQSVIESLPQETQSVIKNQSMLISDNVY